MANTITITGNLAGDPELRFTGGGDAVANFTVCDTPRKFNKQTNEWEDAGDTLFLRCSIWREHAEWATENLTRGQRVTVTGKLKQRSWDTPEGEKRTTVECDAESIAPHPPRNQAGQGQARPQPQARPQAQGGQPPQPQTDPWGPPAGGNRGGATYDEPPF